jgi:Flp pilus assembly protein TadD
MFMGKQEEAREQLENAVTHLRERIIISPQDERLYSSLGIALAGLGRKEEAIREGLRGIELQPVSKEAALGPWRLYEMAWIYVLVGEYEKAIDQVEDYFSLPNGISTEWLKLDPQYDPLRDNPRFQKLLQREKLK